MAGKLGFGFQKRTTFPSKKKKTHGKLGFGIQHRTHIGKHIRRAEKSK